MTKRFILAAMALSLTFLATACNTMQGLGEDIKKGGQAIEKAAGGNNQ